MKSISLVSLLAVVLVSCSTAPQKPVANTLTAKLDSYLTETVDRVSIPGLTVAITRNDSVIYTKALGYRNMDTKEPLTPRNIFHWASVSKTFVSTAVMQLVEKGKINLDEKLTTYLPYFKQQDVWYKDVTIRQMLNHTAGIGDVDDYEWHTPQYDSGALERFVRSTVNDRMLFKPGTDRRYSNTAYEMLGDVIAKVSGMSFDTYVKKNILEPLGMNSSSFLYPEIADSLRVSGHVWAGGPIVSKHYPYNRMHGPSSTLNTSVLEMTRYAFAHLHRGVYNGKRILADSTYDFWWTNSVNIEGKSGIGMTWVLGERNGAKIVMHGGGDTGFRSFFLLVPEKNMSVMFVSNYELIRSYDLATALLDIVMDVEPLPLRRQVGFRFAEIMDTEGIDAAKKFFNETKADTVQRKFYLWEEDDAALAYPGYLYMEQKMYPQAIAMFKFNVEQFPNSGWAHFHLGKGYAESGDKASAKESFRKALELLPGEEEIREALEDVGV
jgi:CubicO group peptidase (beta-lactamase class C family)